MMLVAVYVGALAFGGILLGASLLGADKDGDGDGELDHGGGELDHGGGEFEPEEVELDHGDVGHGEVGHGDGHAAGIGEATRISVTAQDAAVGATGVLVANLLSLRFWMFALASFGLSGLLFTLIGLPDVVGAGLAAPLGLGIGWGAATVVRRLARDTRATEMRTQTLQGREATVVLAIGPEKLGKVRLVHAGQTIELPATTRETWLLERNEPVLVVEVRGGQAVVTSAMPDRKRVHTREQSHRTEGGT